MTPLIARLRAQVAALDPVDDREARSIEEIVAGLGQLPTPLDQHADPTHVTGSALVVSPRGVVLHKHKRLGLWLQPGGHVDPGEAPWQAALRETWEETGLAARHPEDQPWLFHVDAHDGGRGHRHLDLRYVVHGEPATPSPRVGESRACEWFEWEQAIAIADPGLRGALQRLAAIH